MASGQAHFVSLNLSGLKLFTYSLGLGSKRDSNNNFPMPPDPEMPCALQPPAMTKPFTRQLSPIIKRPSGVNVGQPLPMNFLSAALAAGNKRIKFASKLLRTGMSGTTGGGSAESEYSRGSVLSALFSQPPSNKPWSRTRP